MYYTNTIAYVKNILWSCILTSENSHCGFHVLYGDIMYL